jgi:hypothetical protein
MRIRKLWWVYYVQKQVPTVGSVPEGQNFNSLGHERLPTERGLGSMDLSSLNPRAANVNYCNRKFSPCEENNVEVAYAVAWISSLWTKYCTSD